MTSIRLVKFFAEVVAEDRLYIREEIDRVDCQQIWRGR